MVRDLGGGGWVCGDQAQKVLNLSYPEKSVMWNNSEYSAPGNDHHWDTFLHHTAVYIA